MHRLLGGGRGERDGLRLRRWHDAQAGAPGEIAATNRGFYRALIDLYVGLRDGERAVMECFL